MIEVYELLTAILKQACFDYLKLCRYKTKYPARWNFTFKYVTRELVDAEDYIINESSRLLRIDGRYIIDEVNYTFKKLMHSKELNDMYIEFRRLQNE